MAYTNYPSTGSPSDGPQKSKDNRNLVYGVLIAITSVRLMVAIIIYSQSKNKSHEQVQQTQIHRLTNCTTNEKDSLDNEFKSALQRMDSLTGNNAQLAGQTCLTAKLLLIS